LKIIGTKRVDFYYGDGISFDGFDEVEAALRRLGDMSNEDAAKVQEQIERAKQEFRLDLPESQRPRGTLVHNEDGRTTDGPFADMELRLSQFETLHGGTYYLLRVESWAQAPHNLGRPTNWIESQLAIDLGRVRPLYEARVGVYYEPLPEVRFNFAHIISALSGIDGIKAFPADPQIWAATYFHALSEGLYGPKLIVNHVSGNWLQLADLSGIKRRTPRIEGGQLLMSRTGPEVIAPLDDRHRETGPHTMFMIMGRDNVKGIVERDELLAANRQFTEFVDAVEAAFAPAQPN